MKWVQINLLGLIAFNCLAGSIPAAGQNAGNPPPQITLNGITSIFDSRRALFKVPSSDGSSANESYFLAEGQHAGGIELIAVDMNAGRIKVNNHGVIQVIRLCSPANLSTLAASAASTNIFYGNQNYKINFNNGAQLTGAQNVAVVTAQNANAGGNVLGANVGFKIAAGANDGTKINDGANASPSPVSTGGSTALDAAAPDAAGVKDAAQRPEPYSIKAAREFERLRLQTANDVYSGIDEPIPLTPLTPPGTPLALIGPDRAWFPGD
jgi:hypothetical protein